MFKRLYLTLAALTALSVSPAFGEAKKASPISPDHAWHFGGLLGQHDLNQVQRGFQVYWARCAACHGMQGRDFWHLERLGYSEDYLKGMIAEYLTGEGLAYDPSNYSIYALPQSRAEGAPDLSHAVLAKGKTMESGADYIYSLLLGYDRAQDTVWGAATQVALAGGDEAFAQIGEAVEVLDADGSLVSVTTEFEKTDFYLYEDGDDWVLRAYTDTRTNITEYDGDGAVAEEKIIFGHRLDETDPVYEADYAASHEGYTALEAAADAWAHRQEAHMHKIASWDPGQYYNPYKAGGILSMVSPLAMLETGHRTDFTADELMADPSDLVEASYWLLQNQDAREALLAVIEDGQALYQAAQASDGSAGTQDAAKRAYAAFAADVIQPLLDDMAPESKAALSEDMTAFLAWSSDMHLSSRKKTGLYVVLLMAILSILLYFYYREIAKQEFAKQAREGGPWDENH